MQQNLSGNNKGVSIIEMLVVIAILGVTLASLLGLASFSLMTADLTKQTTRANTMAQEAIEVVRNFRDQTRWEVDGLGALTVGSAYHPEKTVSTPPNWTLVPNEDSIDIFTRKVVLEKVWRDENDDIADSGVEDDEDSDTKKVTVTVSWQERGRGHQVKIITYFTNWRQ